MNRSKCIEDVLIRGLDDWVQAAEFASAVQLAGAPKAEIRERSLDVLQEMLQRDLVQIGDVTENGFAAWAMSDSQAIAKIDADWRESVGEPDLGDLFWLNLTEAGERLANHAWKRTTAH